MYCFAGREFTIPSIQGGLHEVDASRTAKLIVAVLQNVPCMFSAGQGLILLQHANVHAFTCGVLQQHFGRSPRSFAIVQLPMLILDIVCRCVHWLSHDDDQMKEEARSLGLIQLLVQQLHHDLHQNDEPPAPHSHSAHTAVSSPSGKSPRSSSAGAGAGGFARHRIQTSFGRSESFGSGSVQPPIPEDGPMPAYVASPMSQSGSLSRSFSLLVAPEAVMRSGPTAAQRFCVVAVLREMLKGKMSHKTAEVALHGLLLPVLHMKVSLSSNRKRLIMSVVLIYGCTYCHMQTVNALVAKGCLCMPVFCKYFSPSM